MKHDTTPDERAETELARAAANDLRGRQSVRTTFKLSEHTIHAVSIVAAHLDIKQKSLFDHLTDDMNAMQSIESDLEDTELRHTKRIPKTYVISRRSLDSLERASKALHTSRDLLIELSVKRLLPIIAAERQQHKMRKEALAELHDQTVNAKELWRKTCLLLGEHDFVSEKIAMAAKALEVAEKNVAEFVDRGHIIEQNPLGT